MKPTGIGLAHLKTGLMASSPPKHIGFEIELGAHCLETGREKTAGGAAHALVAAHHRLYPGPSVARDDGACEFDENGFRVYLDHEHAEICTPLVPSARQLVLAMRDARRVVEACKQEAETEVGPVRVSYNNTNRQGVAWAFHANFLVARPAFDKWRDGDWARLKKQWIPFLVTSLPLVGTGKVGAENGVQNASFQFSQRADFVDAEVALETVASKSLINTRDEPLADPVRFARLHVIVWDTNLAEFSSWLKFGAAQVLLALIEEGVPLPDLALADPVRATHVVSRDLDLRERLKLGNGRCETALGAQRRLAEAAARRLEGGCAACRVPDAALIVQKWLETLDDLEARRARLCRRLDWCAKLNLLRRAQELKGVDRQQVIELDLYYAELGGSYEKLEAAGAVDRLEDFLPHVKPAPAMTGLVPREQARAVLISRFGCHLASVDWDHAVVRDEAGRHWHLGMVDPVDSRGLLEIVTSAPDWPACLDDLISNNFAAETTTRGAAGSDDRRSAPELASVERNGLHKKGLNNE